MSECDSLRDPVYVPEDDDLNIDDELVEVPIFGQTGCKTEIFAACTKQGCQRLLRYDHFLDNLCEYHSLTECKNAEKVNTLDAHKEK